MGELSNKVCMYVFMYEGERGRIIHVFSLF